MDFFNIGTWEALVLALLALLLFGPEDMLKAARKLGAFAQELRHLWQEAASSLDLDTLDESQGQTENAVPHSSAASDRPSSHSIPSEDHDRP
jgi:Sec-independent protein translocase protein TatA